MAIDEQERLRRWRLILGGESADGLSISLSGADQGMDGALEALYGANAADASRQAGLGASAPNVTRWLGDIRTYFPTSVVQVMQQDAFNRLGLRQMLLEPELLATVEPDVHLVGTLLSLSKVIPEQTKETARMVVRKVVDDIERRLRAKTIQAVRGSINRATRTNRPRPNEIDWDRTIRANLKHYQPEQGVIIPERVIGHGRKRQSLRDIVLCVDQSGSMATSVVYSSVFAAVLASLPAVSLRMVVFDTAVVDLTEELHDPVDLLFGTRLGGGTDINRALTYCQGLITRPGQTILVLITDLYEGGNAAEMLKRVEETLASGTQVICLLALSDSGAPVYHDGHAATLGKMGVPTFACTPDLFPDLIAAAIARQDVNTWAARNDIALARAG
jgi:Mg-chelatase subunit ChlD